MCLGHVHVIDDDAVFREIIEDVLSGAGYDVRVWADARSFLDCVPDVAPLVLVSDVRLPEISGIEMYGLLRERGFQAPVIYISGESSLQEGIDAMKLGAMDFLVKPFTYESFLQAVAKGMELDQARRRKAQEESRIRRCMALLTPREREVHGLMLKGCCNSEIMTALKISLPTVKQYKSMVMRKLDVKTLSQLMEFSEVGPAGE